MDTSRLVPAMPSAAEKDAACHVNGTPFLGPILAFEGVRVTRRVGGEAVLTHYQHVVQRGRGPEFSGAAFPEFGAE
jgi:hypothetical protein